MPGFVDVKSYMANDGERLMLVWWRDEETLKAWREHARHRVAQRTGRDHWYQYYRMDVAEVVRTRPPSVNRRHTLDSSGRYFEVAGSEFCQRFQ
jgi:heme-degrading monooxygenase HmoA